MASGIGLPQDMTPDEAYIQGMADVAALACRKFDDLMRFLYPVLPNATVGMDNDGQLVIYTDMTLVGDNLVPFQFPE